jgi:hypothetical protein
MARDDDYDDYERGDNFSRPAENWPHSGVGIASFCAGILALFMVLAGFVLVVLGIDPRPHRYGGGPPPAAVLGGLVIIGAGIVALIGTGLGIGGVCQSQRKKVFGNIGLCINALLLLGGLAIAVLALASRRL